MTWATKAPYEGILATPMAFDLFRGIPLNARRSETSSLIASKLEALCRYYEIDVGKVNRQLVLTLARRYVPGFQLNRSAQARRKRWNDLRLAELWLLFRQARAKFPTDKGALEHIARDQRFRRFAGDVKPVWVGQLLDKARHSPLVQMLESSNPIDREFARRFMDKHLLRP
jgi:hypothetical protein